MDQQIEELKELVRRNIAVSEDTNRIMHSLHRSAWLSHAVRLVWVLLLLGSSFYAYQYARPYINQILGIYTNIQSLQEKAQGFLNQAQGTTNSTQQ